MRSGSLTCAHLLALVVAACGKAPRTEVPERRTLEELHVNGYTVRLLSDVENPWFSVLEILRGDHLVFSDSAHGFTIGNRRARDESFPVGRDLTGDGRPNLLISKNLGGAKARTDYLLFEIGERFRLVAELSTEWGDTRFRDLDGDAVPEVVTQDTTYSYWPSSFAASPRPSVVLCLDGSTYVPAPDLMRRPAGDFSDLARRAGEIRLAPWENWRDAPAGLWEYPLDLMYAGHAALAWRFIDLAWPAGREGKQCFVEELGERVSESPYHDTVSAMQD